MSPLLMNNIAAMRRPAARKRQNPTADEEAKSSCYWVDAEQSSLGVPARAVHGSMLKSGNKYRLPDRQNTTRVMTSALHIAPEVIPLNTTEFDTDERSVVIMKKRIYRGRAKIKLPWEITFSLFYDPVWIPFDMARDFFPQVFFTSGQLVGLLDYRVENKGPFGKYRLSRYELLPQAYEEPAPEPKILGFGPEDPVKPKSTKSTSKPKKKAA